MNESFDPKILQTIYRHLLQNPGLSLNELAKISHIRTSEVQEYVQFMEEKRKIYSESIEGSNKYFVKQRRGRKGTRDQRTKELRKQIFDLLLKNPGLNLSKIADELHMSAQLAEYHLLYLKRNNLILSVKEKGGYYRRFYVKDSEVGVKEKEVVSLLRQKHLLKIVILILKKSNIRHKKLSRKLDIHPSTLSHHLNRLSECGLIEAVTYGKEKGYRIKNKKEVINILRKYIFDVTAEGFRDIWEDMDPRELEK